MLSATTTDPPRREPPRPLVWLSAGILVVTVAIAVAGAWQTGIAWDETYHVQRMNNYLDDGWYALDRDLELDGPAAPGRKTFVYGPVTMILLHTGSELLGVDGRGEVATSPDAFRVRHLGVVLIALIGGAAAAAISRRLLGRGWGLLTAAILGAVPVWTGMSMVNIKDVPVATGLTLVTLALVQMVGAPEGDRIRRRAGRVVLLAAGATLAIGTRPGIWTAVLAALTTAAGLVLIGRRVGVDQRPDPPPGLAWLGEAAAGMLAAAALLVAAYPRAFRAPWDVLRRSAEQSANFDIGLDSTRAYLFEHVGLGIPVVLTALWLFGTVLGVRYLLGWLFGGPVRPEIAGPDRAASATAIGIALVGVQAWTLPLLAIALDSELYNGLRQMLFTAPACAVLATIGLKRLAELRAPGPAGRRRSIALIAVASAALVVPVIDQARLFPYAYAYANVPGDLVGTDLRTDYWRTSFAALIDQIPNDGQLVCSPFDIPDGSVTRYSSEGTVDCRTSPIGPFAPFWAERGRTAPYAIANTEFYVAIEGGDPTPTNCVRIGDVTRPRHGRTIVMSLLARCRLRAAPLPPGGTGFDATPRTFRYAVRGWEAGVLRGGLSSAGSSASIAFRAPWTCARTTCLLTVAATVPPDLTVTATAAHDPGTTAGRLLDIVRITPRRIRIALPPDVVAAAGADGVWLTFARADGGELGMSMRILRLLPG